jgi:tRNA pseudouridine55 synthase
MEGILLIDKDLNWTSFDCVAKIRSILRQEYGKKIKVGHCGTLDPLATGLLIILVGSYTKRADELIKKDKIYSLKMRLGYTSPTGDAEGVIEQQSDYKPNISEIEKVLKIFTGDIEQVPPIYSAIKINGVRSYKLAHSGKSVEMQPRPVKIYNIKLESYKYPKLSLITEVSSGTYIRSLSSDIGQQLKTGAYLTELRRLSIDKYSVDNALKMADLNSESLKSHLFTEL